MVHNPDMDTLTHTPQCLRHALGHTPRHAAQHIRHRQTLTGKMQPFHKSTEMPL